MNRIIKRFRASDLYNRDSESYFVLDKNKIEFTNDATQELVTQINEIDVKRNEVKTYQSELSSIDKAIQEAIQKHTDDVLNESQLNTQIAEQKTRKQALRNKYDIELNP